MIGKKLIIAIVALSGFMTVSLAVVNPGQAYAQATNNCDNSSTFLGFPKWYKYINVSGTNGNCNLNVPKDASGNIQFDQVIGPVLFAVFEILMRLAGLVAVGFVIYGGFQYILSQGEPAKLTAARGTIINALVGMVIAISATVIVNLVAGALL